MAREKTVLTEQGNTIEAERHRCTNAAKGTSPWTGEVRTLQEQLSRKLGATGTAVEIRDRLTKQKRLEVLDQEEEWLATQLDRIGRGCTTKIHPLLCKGKLGGI